MDVLAAAGIATDGHRAPAQQPAVRLVPACVHQVVFRGVLQVAGQRVEPEAAGRSYVGAPYDLGGGEHAAVRGIRRKLRRGGGPGAGGDVLRDRLHPRHCAR